MAKVVWVYDAGISYKRKANDVENRFLEKNILFEENRGAKIKEEPITNQKI